MGVYGGMGYTVTRCLSQAVSANRTLYITITSNYNCENKQVSHRIRDVFLDFNSIIEFNFPIYPNDKQLKMCYTLYGFP